MLFNSLFIRVERVELKDLLDHTSFPDPSGSKICEYDEVLRLYPFQRGESVVFQGEFSFVIKVWCFG
jgi:hypothetical protein